jgi:hypothetical protein
VTSGEPRRAPARFPKVPGFDDWTIEAWEIAQERSRAARRILIGFLGALFAAFLWASTAADARLLETGKYNPLLDGHPVSTLFSVLWVAVYGIAGMASLHAAFGLIVASLLALGIWGVRAEHAAAQRHRRLSDAQREAARQRSVAAVLESTKGTPAGERLERAAAESERVAGVAMVARERSPGHSLVVWTIRLLPIALAAAIAALVWSALRA